MPESLPQRRHRTIWESIVEIVEDFDSDNASTTKIMTSILLNIGHTGFTPT